MNTFKKIIRASEFSLIVVFAVVVVIFSLINPNYISIDNIRNIFNSAFATGSLAVGMACLLISHQLDLSAGATGVLSGMLVALLLKTGMAWPLAILIILLFGAVTGLIKAFFVNKLGFSSFIATLGLSTVFSGLTLVLTNAQNIPVGNEQFWKLGSYNVFGIFPLPFFIMAILMIIYGIILAKTRFGRSVYMTGGNANAARLAGISPKIVTTILFVNGSVISALTGILMAARMHMASPDALTGSDLDCITAAILGGVAYTGGRGNMFGVFCGVLLFTAFQNGLVVIGLNSYYRVVAKGLLLVAALALSFYREKAREKALKQ